MGRIRKIIKNIEIPKPPLNNRFTVELCENVHIHYRNLRMEFSKEEFIFLLKLMKNIDEKEVESFNYDQYNFNTLIHTTDLPDKTYYDTRLQIEQQIEGHFHLHYRNLRFEVNDLRHLGFKKYKLNFFEKKLNKYLEKKNNFEKFILNKFFKTKIFPDNSFLPVDTEYYNNHLKGKDYKYVKIKNIKLSKLLVHLYSPSGDLYVPIKNAPPFQLLNGNKEHYISYCKYKNSLPYDTKIHNIETFEKLIQTFDPKSYGKNDLIIIFNGKPIIRDGQHRAAILLDFYNNPNKKIKIIDICLNNFIY